MFLKVVESLRGILKKVAEKSIAEIVYKPLDVRESFKFWNFAEMVDPPLPPLIFGHLIVIFDFFTMVTLALRTVHISSFTRGYRN